MIGIKLAVAGKGGVGKTTISAWLGTWLAKCQNQSVWMIDADPAISLGLALGFEEQELPLPLMKQKELIRERIGTGMLSLNPVVSDLPEQLAVQKVNDQSSINLMVLGGITTSGAGCACGANVLSKEIIRDVVSRDEYIIVDLEAGVEHLGRGTIRSIDGLIIVTEPSHRSIFTAKRIAEMAEELGVDRIGFVMNRIPDDIDLTGLFDEERLIGRFPEMTSLRSKQLHDPSVVNIPEEESVERICQQVLSYFNPELIELNQS